MEKVKIQFYDETGKQELIYALEGDSGIDIRAKLDLPVSLHPLERYRIPTGLYCDIPKGYELQVRSKSGNSIRYGIVVLNQPGTVDSSYKRKEIGVLLINLSNQIITINNNEHVAQLVCTPVVEMDVIKVKEMKELGTSKRTGGFGSTGNNLNGNSEETTTSSPKPTNK